MERALRSLVLIRAKHLAESVTTAMLLTDRDGTLIFANEAAEGLTGYRFSDLGPLTPEEWLVRLQVRARDGQPFPVEDMPGWRELQGERPSTGHVMIKSHDGSDHVLATCAFPLFTEQREFDGALVLLWDDGLGG